MKKILFNFSMTLSAAALLLSCEKAELKDGGGKTLFKLTEGGPDPVVMALNTNPVMETIRIGGVFRDASNNADYNKAATVVLNNSQALLDAYNDDNDTEYELLPTGAYTITAESGVTVSGNAWTINLAAGELDRSISIVLNKALLDLSKQYAFGLEIASTTVGEPSLGTGKGIVNVLIKNSYDGVYEVTGNMVDAGGFTGKFPMNIHLITTGANTVASWDPDVFGDYITPMLNAGANSGFGAFAPVFTFDPATNKITSVVNYHGQPAPSNGRYAAIDNSGVNEWDPVTGDIKVKFFMYQPSVVPLPGHRVSFDWNMERTGPRP